MNICCRNKNTLQKTRYIFDVNMFAKSGFMGLKTSDSYILYGGNTIIHHYVYYIHLYKRIIMVGIHNNVFNNYAFSLSLDHRIHV